MIEILGFINRKEMTFIKVKNHINNMIIEIPINSQAYHVLQAHLLNSSADPLPPVQFNNDQEAD